MKIKFLGAAQTVTGSCFVLEANGVRFTVDCGMHQGNSEIEERNRDISVYDPQHIDFVLVTHAHIDHSGLLPRMVKYGFKGDIYCTPPTRDLLEIMLLDSAHIQVMETAWNNKKSRRHGGELVEPIYDETDAQNTIPLFRSVEYRQPFEPAPGIRVTYRDAGHILGSAFIELNITEGADTYRLLFSGDLGRPDQLLLNDPSVSMGPTDYLFLESTYGDRNHKNEQNSRAELAEAIAYSYEEGEKVIIPAFAVERTQEVIYSLYLLHKEGKLPADMPVYLDSPLAIRATEVFRKHHKYFDKATQALLESGEDPLSLANLQFTLRTEQSQAINTTEGPAVVISASGMCNAGRVKHHLRHNLWRSGASIVFVGYQANGTPGRRLVDGVKKIRILGESVAVNAKIFTINGFSAHAGQSQILQWLGAFKRNGMRVFLVHGELQAQQTLAGLIKQQYGFATHIPSMHEECILEPGKEPEVLEDALLARPRIDWDFVLSDAEAKIAELRKRIPAVSDRSYELQSDIRLRILEINREFSELISEL